MATSSAASTGGGRDIHLRGVLEQLHMAVYCHHKHQYDDHSGGTGKCAKCVWRSLCADHGLGTAGWAAAAHRVHVLPETDCSRYRWHWIEGLAPVRGPVQTTVHVFLDRWMENDLPPKVYALRPDDELHLGVGRAIRLWKGLYLW